MKSLKVNLSKVKCIVYATLFFLLSCSKENIQSDNEMGTLDLSFQNQTSNRLKSAIYSVDSISAIVLSVKDGSGKFVYKEKWISLQRIGDQFVCPPLLFKPGTYKLTDFLLVNRSGMVLFLTPKERSTFEFFVNDPLDIIFNISKNAVTKLKPQVISVENTIPEDLGYATFNFELIKTIEVLLSVFSCNNANSFDLTEAELTVASNGITLLKSNLKAMVNTIKLPTGYDKYDFLIKKAGFADYSINYSLDTLKKHMSPIGPPITFLLCYKGPVFWNTLGSKSEVENSKIGTNGKMKGGAFIPGVYGNAFSLNYDQDTFLYFPMNSGIMDLKKGCIEFWAKFTNPEPEVTHGTGTWYEFFVYRPANTNQDFRFGMNANNGLGCGGLTGDICSLYPNRFSSCGTQYNTNSILITDILGAGKEQSWHHYAFIWDYNGITGVHNGTRKLAIYMDGVLKTANWNQGYLSDYIPADLNISKIYLLYNQSNRGSVALDNLKIYNYAKTDFSDRFSE